MGGMKGRLEASGSREAGGEVCMGVWTMGRCTVPTLKSGARTHVAAAAAAAAVAAASIPAAVPSPRVVHHLAWSKARENRRFEGALLWKTRTSSF